MRKSKTFSISQDLLDNVSEYKSKNNLRSDSQALERMLLQVTTTRNLLKDVLAEVIAENHINLITAEPTVKVAIPDENDKIKEALNNTMDGIFKDMREK